MGVHWPAAVVLLAIATSVGAADLPLAVTTRSDLGFGQLVATASSGTVTVSPAGGRTYGGGVILANGLGVSAGAFALTGDLHASYSITLPSECTLSGGGGSMTVDQFSSSPSGAGSLGPAGSQMVTLGATLHVGAAQASGSYSGTYAVMLAYN
jgi:hypothetical protein